MIDGLGKVMKIGVMFPNEHINYHHPHVHVMEFFAHKPSNYPDIRTSIIIHELHIDSVVRAITQNVENMRGQIGSIAY